MLALFDRLSFLLGETIAGLRRNGLMSLAAITTAAVALALFGCFAVVAYSLGEETKTWPDKFEMRVVMTNDATPTNLSDVGTRIRDIRDAYALELQTKEQNWAETQASMRKELGDLSDLPNPLPDTFTFRIRDLKRSDVIAEAVRKMPGVEEVQYLAKEIQAALRVTQFVRLMGAAVTGVLFLAAMALIYNAVRLTLAARSPEIRVMRLVGASTNTIRTPFVLEAVIQGGMGGVLAGLFMWAAAQPVARLVTQIGLHQVTPGSNFVWLAIGGLALLGAAAGSVCGTTAVHRYLRI